MLKLGVVSTAPQPGQPVDDRAMPHDAASQQRVLEGTETSAILAKLVAVEGQLLSRRDRPLGRFFAETLLQALIPAIIGLVLLSGQKSIENRFQSEVATLESRLKRGEDIYQRQRIAYESVYKLVAGIDFAAPNLEYDSTQRNAVRSQIGKLYAQYSGEDKAYLSQAAFEAAEQFWWAAIDLKSLRPSGSSGIQDLHRCAEGFLTVMKHDLGLDEPPKVAH